METEFTPEQLKDRRIQEADAILRRCVHCGFCTATCPTYLLLGDERDSPRGRIYLIKSMLEGKATPRQVRPHLDRCLSCYSCMTTCPSGVDYLHLSDLARTYIEKAGGRQSGEEFIRKLLRIVLPHPGRFRLALMAAMAARPFRRLFAHSRSLKAMLDLAPARKPEHGKFTSPQTVKTKKPRRGRVILMTGCVQEVLNPKINDASVRFLNHLGYDVVISGRDGCCGALSLHMGKEAEAKAFARKNIDAWHNLRELGPIDAIIINASGCGTTVKDYATPLRARSCLRREGEIHLFDSQGHHGICGATEDRGAAGLERYPRRLSFRLLDAARPETHRSAALASAQRRIYGRRDPGGAHLLRLGRHLQYPAAGACERASRPQAGQYRGREARLRRRRKYRLHQPVRAWIRAGCAHG